MSYPEYDQKFKITYNTSGKWPYIYFADTTQGTAGGYINNSLEGLYFDQRPADDGTITIPSGQVTPNFYFYEHGSGGENISLGGISVVDNICTITTDSPINELAIGDFVSITGVGFDIAHPFINGTWKVKSVAGNSFTFEINAPNATGFDSLLYSAKATKDIVFEIRDNRPTTDAKGFSFTSTLFTPRQIHDVGVGYRRILPSDLYTRFSFQSGNTITPQGGINSNLFNVVDDSGNNIKPALWAYFFGYSTPPGAPPNSVFEIVLNSYAIVLRPSGDGSRLEFAIVKFNYGSIVDWFDIINAGNYTYTDWTISGTDLGYLLSTNPEVKVGTTSLVTELAKSDSFTYSSESPVKLNLKITIRKHLLSDSATDNTYLVNLLSNDDYNSFGAHAHYDSILHAYINKPNPLYAEVAESIAVRTDNPIDLTLMPILYFKFNNIDENNVNEYSSVTSNPGSSRIIQESLIFRQVNATPTNPTTGTSYLY